MEFLNICTPIIEKSYESKGFMHPSLFIECQSKVQKDLSYLSKLLSQLCDETNIKTSLHFDETIKLFYIQTLFNTRTEKEIFMNMVKKITTIPGVTGLLMVMESWIPSIPNEHPLAKLLQSGIICMSQIPNELKKETLVALRLTPLNHTIYMSDITRTKQAENIGGANFHTIEKVKIGYSNLWAVVVVYSLRHMNTTMKENHIDIGSKS